MSDSHSDSYFAKLLIGFASIIGSIIVIFYAVFELDRDTDWYFWAILSAFLMCSGIYFSLHAFVHKVKSDFNRRRRQRDEHKSMIKEE